MKSILSISITLHAAVFSTALVVGSQRGVLHLAAPQQRVLEMRLSAAPNLPRAARNTAPELRRNVETMAAPPTEIAPPKVDVQTAEIVPKQPSVNAGEAGKSCNCAPVQSASVTTAGQSGNVEAPHGIGNTAQVVASTKVNELPWIVSSPPPEYPREARRKGWIGRVGVHVLISDQGTVQQVEVLSSSGHSELDEAALAALRKWTFHPAQKDGHAISAWVVVPVLFRLG